MKASQPLVNYAPASIAAREIGELSEKVMSLEANVPLNGNIQFFVERVAAQLAEKAS
jgi:flagellar biosynthesis protein FlhG